MSPLCPRGKTGFDESATSDLTGHGEEDYLMAGGRDSGYQRAADEALARAAGRVRLGRLFDRRRGRPSSKGVPLALVEQRLGLYRERYFDLNVHHFHEKLGEQHQIQLSYTWVKQALQGAGLVAKGRKRGVHHQRRERRPLPGMLLHIDGSRHRWLPCRFHPFSQGHVSFRLPALATWVEDYTSVPMDVFPPHEPRRLCATCASGYSSRRNRITGTSTNVLTQASAFSRAGSKPSNSQPLQEIQRDHPGN